MSRGHIIYNKRLSKHFQLQRSLSYKMDRLIIIIIRFILWRIRYLLPLRIYPRDVFNYLLTRISLIFIMQYWSIDSDDPYTVFQVLIMIFRSPFFLLYLSTSFILNWATCVRLASTGPQGVPFSCLLLLSTVFLLSLLFFLLLWALPVGYRGLSFQKFVNINSVLFYFLYHMQIFS